MVSVVIAYFNGKRFIRQTLEAVGQQTLHPTEIVIVDDGSTETGLETVSDLIEKLNIRVLRKRNGGQSSARNFGAARTSAPLLAFLDQDDTWYPNHLAILAAEFGKQWPVPLGWAYSDVDTIDADGTITDARRLRNEPGHPKRDILACIRSDMNVLPSAALISREAFNRVGGFSRWLRGFEDDDLFLRILKVGYISSFHPEPLSQRRKHPNQASRSAAMDRSAILYSLKLMLTHPRHVRSVAQRFTERCEIVVQQAAKQDRLDRLRIARAHLAMLRWVPTDDPASRSRRSAS